MLKLKEKFFWQKKIGELAEKTICASSNHENDEKNCSNGNFEIFCGLPDCSETKQLLTMLVVDEELHNEQLLEFQKMVGVFYTEQIIPKNSSIYEKYESNMKSLCNMRWYSDPNFEVKKNIQLSVGSCSSTPMNFPGIWKDITGVSDTLSLDKSDSCKIVAPSHYKILYARDKQQLFELLCLQIRCVAMAYGDYLENTIKNGKQNDESNILLLLKAILDVYAKFCNVGKVFSRLFNDMEKDFLQNFSLNWLSINQFFFYKDIYANFENFIPECIIKLKEDVELELYKQYVYKLIDLDEELTSIKKNYSRFSYPALRAEKNSESETQRLKTMQKINNFFVQISKIEADIKIADHKSFLDWVICSEDNSIWQNVLHFIKHERPICENVDFLIHNPAQGADCQCRQCLVFHNLNGITKAQKETLLKNNSMEQDESNTEVYHISWALFKHHKDRKCYNEASIQTDQFCVFQKQCCNERKCSVAVSILIGVYPPQFSKYLLRTYMPLIDKDRESILKVPELELRKLFECKPNDIILNERDVGDFSEAHLFAMKNMTWDGDDHNECSLASALAENYAVVAKFPQTSIFFSYFNTIFKIDLKQKDIIFDLDWLEQITKSTLLKRFLLKSVEISWNDDNEKVVDEIERKMKFLNLSCDDTNVKDPKDSKMLEDLEKSISLFSKTSISIKSNGETIKKQYVTTNTKILKETPKGVDLKNKIKDEKSGVIPKAAQDAKCKHKHEVTSNESQEQTQSCVCHYCTLFEKNDASSRNIETRTRLRKRLQQQQQQLKKEVKNNVTKENNKCNLHSKSATNTTVNQKTAEIPKKEVIKQTFINNKNKLDKTDIMEKTEHNVKPIENLLKYIEGEGETKKVKKVKVKRPKKNVVPVVPLEEKIQNLEVLNEKMRDVEVKIKQYLNQLMQIRRGKQKDETRIKPIEEKLQEESSQKSKFTVEILQEYNQLKQMSPTFDIKTHEPNLKFITMILNDSEKMKQQKTSIETVNQNVAELGKRMVTIRRINLPDSQPQVTVTAKGQTPDKDQLLYAFVNGHLVPGAMISSNKKASASNSSQQPPQVSTVPQKIVTEKNVPKNQDQSNRNSKKTQKADKTPTISENSTKSKKKDKNERNEKNQTNKIENERQTEKKKNQTLQKSSSANSIEKKKSGNPPDAVKNSVKSSTNKNYIDPEFDNNAFKLLNMDVSDSETSDIGSIQSKEASKNKKNEKNKKKVSNQNVKPQVKPNVVDKSAVVAAAVSAPGKNVKESNVNKNQKLVGKVQRQQQQHPQPHPQFQPHIPSVARDKFVPKTSNGINSGYDRQQFVKNSPLSITDQLNKGIRVEGLRLPPGITLTKIDQTAMEALREKQNSINNITLNMADQKYAKPNDMAYGQQPFVVNAMPIASESIDNSKKSKKKKNKKKKGGNEEVQNGGSSHKSDMVTLKNPMFNQDNNLMNMMEQQGYGNTAARRAEQTASIIKNENGMYTIRNPAFQNSFFRMNDNSAEVKPTTSNENSFSSPLPLRPQPGPYYNPPMNNFVNNDMKPQMPTDAFGYSNFGMDSNGYQNKRYDDFSFLETLQPGQHLNSEVTIHNISESKFFKRNDQQREFERDTNFHDNEDIPQACSYPSNNNNVYRNQTDNVFAPNQMVNLSELESEERDIESFKRFDYYFNPPKNKPKVNINVKDIVVHSRKT